MLGMDVSHPMRVAAGFIMGMGYPRSSYLRLIDFCITQLKA